MRNQPSPSENTSQSFFLYNPQGRDVAGLEEDLEMFSDPEQYPQESPQVKAAKQEILALLNRADETSA